MSTVPMPPVPTDLGVIELTPAAREYAERLASEVSARMCLDDEVAEFHALIAPFLVRLRGPAMKMTRHPEDADDLVQDTLVRALRFRKNFKQGSNIKAWLFTILRNTAINSYHRDGRRRTFQRDVSAQMRSIGPTVALGNSTSQPPGPDVVEANSNKIAVHRAIEALPPDYRTAVTLCDLEGYSYKEIAEVMKCPIGTVMSRIYRGRKQLHKLLYEHARAVGLVDDAAGIDRDSERSTGA